jgi:hypothetical protein
MKHKHHMFGGFTSKYRVDRLVYFEKFVDVNNAIAREKQTQLGSICRRNGESQSGWQLELSPQTRCDPAAITLCLKNAGPSSG